MAQTILHVMAKGRRSMRDAIINDKQLEKFNLTVSEQKRPTRSPGWSKLHSTQGYDGAVNIQWIDEANMLLCRIVTKGDGDPSGIAGDLLRYLLARRKSQITSITIAVAE